MKLIDFQKYDDSGLMTFVADKIVAITASQVEENNTSVFVISAGGDNDEFIVREKYDKVRAKLEQL